MSRPVCSSLTALSGTAPRVALGREDEGRILTFYFQVRGAGASGRILSLTGSGGAEAKPGRKNCMEREGCEKQCLFPRMSQGIVSPKDRGCWIVNMFVF